MQSHHPEHPLILQRAADELERLRCYVAAPLHFSDNGECFPQACKSLLYSIPGNTRCVDCGQSNPDWASVTYGVLLCVQCSGIHRSYGVATSRVRSITMDAWSHSQVLSMLEGGNHQLSEFFRRHKMGRDSTVSDQRYQTKAAKFYRTHLSLHVTHISNSGCYKGRRISRRRTAGTAKIGGKHQSHQTETEDKALAVGCGLESEISRSKLQQKSYQPMYIGTVVATQ